MSTKLVKTFPKADGTYIYLYRDSVWQEWQVSPRKKSDPLFVADQMYHTSDKEDAIYHAKQLVEGSNREYSVRQVLKDNFLIAADGRELV